MSYLADTEWIPAGRTLNSYLRESVSLYPRRPALQDGESDIDYRELWRRSRAVATGLQHLGVKAGDRVAVIEPNSPAFVYAFMACAALGAVVVPIPPDYRQRELDFILRHSEPAAIVTVSEWRGFDFRVGLRATYQDTAMPPVVITNVLDAHGLSALLDLPSLPDADGLPDWEADVGLLLQYTSGTTGQPKGCYHSHNSLCRPTLGMRKILPLAPSDRVMVFANMTHLLGLLDGMFLTLMSGGCLVPVQRWHSQSILSLCESVLPTVIVAVPPVYLQLRQIARQPVIPALRTVWACISAGTALPDSTAIWIQEELGAAVIVQYGLTEIANCFNTRLLAQGAVRNGCAGLPTTGGAEGKVIDAAGKIVERGQLGEICLRSSWPFQGYYRQPERTAELIDSAGWVHTGDVGYVDHDGYLHVLSRTNDLIVRGGQNIYPDEVESLLMELGYVEAAAIVGAPDDRLGERTVAFVEARPEGGEVTRHRVVDDLCQSVAWHKIPDAVVVVPELPRTASGKVRRAVLREWAAASTATEPVRKGER